MKATRAMEILDDPERESAASPFLRLEVLPQAVFNNALHGGTRGREGDCRVSSVGFGNRTAAASWRLPHARACIRF